MIDPWYPLEHPVRAVDRVFFELSNVCNLTDVHKKCPLNQAQGPEHMSSRLYLRSVEWLGHMKWSGMIGLNLYNEPTMDPRLFMFIERTRTLCPGARISLITNGTYLSQTLVDEMRDAGASRIVATVYSPTMLDRLRDIRGIQLWEDGRLDDRLLWYDRLIQLGTTKRCFAPISELCISHQGLVRLCCYDWKSRHAFGDLNVQSLDDVLRNDDMWRVYADLAHGKRTLDLCTGCSDSRGSRQLQPMHCIDSYAAADGA